MAPIIPTLSTAIMASASELHRSDEAINDNELWRISLSDIINTTAFAILMLFTFIGNLLVVTTVIKSKKLRSRTHFYTTSLAVANLLMAGTVMPIRVISFVDKAVWVAKPKLCKTYGTFFVLCCTVTVYTLAATSLDRYFSISRYKWYIRLLTDRRTVGFILLCWSVAILVSFAFADFGDDGYRSIDCKLSRTFSTPYVYTFVSIEVLTPVTVMLILQCKVMKTAVTYLHAVDVRGREMKNLDYAEFPPIAKESNWSKLAIRITSSFVIFWIPRCIFLLLDNSNTDGIHAIWDGFTEIMTYCFPASFALLLCCWSKEFKEQFMDLLCPYHCYQRRKDTRKYHLRDLNKVKPSTIYKKHPKNFVIGHETGTHPIQQQQLRKSFKGV